MPSARDFLQSGNHHLAFHSNETSKDKLSIIYNWLSIIDSQVHSKLHKHLLISTCSLHWNIKVVEKFVKNLFYGEKHSFIECTRRDQKVRGKVLLNRIAFIDFNENS